MRNPIIHLVEKRRRGQYGAAFIASTAAVAAYLVMLFAWPHTGGSPAVEATEMAGILKVLGVVLLVVVPLVACLPTARFFATLRQARQLDDLLITGLTPASIVDGVAASSARSVVPVGVLGAVVALGTAEAVRAPLTLGLVLWGPVLAGLAFLLAYPTLLLSATRRDRQAVGLLSMGVALAAILEAGYDGSTAGGLALIAVWCCGWARVLCLASLGTDEVTRPVARMLNLSRFPLRVRHPILMREWARQAHSAPGGLWTAAVWQLLPLPALFWLAQSTSAGWHMALMLLLFVLQPLRAVWRSGLALVMERDAGTLDLLHQSPLRACQYVDGWALTGAVAAALESLLTWPVVWLWMGAASVIPMLCLLVLIGASGYLGVMMSSVAPSRTIARRFLHVWMALYLGFGVAPIFLAASVSSADSQSGWLLLPLIGIGALWLFRLWAISRVQEDAYLPGFSA